MAKDERLVRFGQRLRELREEKGMSRKQLVDLAELSERAIIKWELGEREPGWFNVLALAHALNVGVEAFLVQPSPTEPPGRGRPRKAVEKDGGKSKRSEMRKGQLPKDGTEVVAVVPASEEHDRPAREIRGTLHTRQVPFGTQCWVDGVQVDENTVRPVGVDCTTFADSPTDEPSPRRGRPRKAVEATDEGKAKRMRKRAEGKK